MEIFKFNFAAASDLHIIEHTCGYVRYYENSSGGGLDPRILVRGINGGWSAELLPGEWMKPPKMDRGLIVTNMSGGAISGKLLVAEDGGAVGSDRIQGNVSVIDTNRSKVLSNAVFQTAQFQANVAAQYSHICVYNKSTTNVKLAVWLLTAYSSFATQTDMARGGNPGWTVGNTPENRHVGGPTSTNHEIQKTTSGALLGAQTYFGGRTLLAGLQQDLPRGDPAWVVDPNTCLIVRALTVNVDLTVTFLVEEFT